MAQSGSEGALGQPQPQSQPQYGLALHTTTPELGLAIDNFAGDAEQSVVDLGRSLAAELHLRLADFLQPRSWPDLQFLAVAKGPGGFTGARMGMVVARTLAQQLNVPLFAISTLAAYAEREWASGRVPNTQAIALSMPAQRGQRFTALYRRVDVGAQAEDEAKGPLWLPQALREDQVTAPEDWQTWLDALDLGAALDGVIHLEVESGLADCVSSLLQMAHHRYQIGDRPPWEQALPFYGQHPVTFPATA